MARDPLQDNCPEVGCRDGSNFRKIFRNWIPPWADLWKIFHKSARLAEPEDSGALGVGFDVEHLVPIAAVTLSPTTSTRKSSIQHQPPSS
jgi:hypothetical protein